jgi:hypothetical protein
MSSYAEADGTHSRYRRTQDSSEATTWSDSLRPKRTCSAISRVAGASGCRQRGCTTSTSATAYGCDRSFVKSAPRRSSHLAAMHYTPPSAAQGSDSKRLRIERVVEGSRSRQARDPSCSDLQRDRPTGTNAPVAPEVIGQLRPGEVALRLCE